MSLPSACLVARVQVPRHAAPCRKSDAVHAIGLALDLDLQLPVGGAKGEFDVAAITPRSPSRRNRLTSVSPGMPVPIGLQLDRDVLRGRQRRARGKANLELEYRGGGIRVEPGRGGGNRVPVIRAARRGTERHHDAERLEAVAGKPAGMLCGRAIACQARCRPPGRRSRRPARTPAAPACPTALDRPDFRIRRVRTSAAWRKSPPTVPMTPPMIWSEFFIRALTYLAGDKHGIVVRMRNCVHISGMQPVDSECSERWSER